MTSRRTQRGLVAALLLSLAMTATAEEAPRLPADVARFVERRDLCDHFRDEEPYDAARRRFLAQKMRELCTGTDKQLAALKAKYRSNAEVSKKLGEYEPTIE